MTTLARICVFCGSSAGNRPVYAAAAIGAGNALVARGIDLVYGGGNVGLMGIVATTVLDAGGEVDGVIPRQLQQREVGDPGIDRLHVVETMHERKALMGELCDGYLALPGGLGTLEELFEVATWSQLGIHAKPIGVLDVEGFYGPLIAMLDGAVAAGMLSPENRDRILIDADIERLLDRMASWQAPPTPVWLTSDET